MGIIPTDDEISLYVVQNHALPTNHIRRYSLRVDGFVSVHAGYEGGEFVTKPFIFSGSYLVVNAATSAAGSVFVEVQDAYGNPFKKYTLEDSIAFYGDQIDHQMVWEKRKDFKKFQGQPIRLRFVIRDADLYSIRFTP